MGAALPGWAIERLESAGSDGTEDERKERVRETGVELVELARAIGGFSVGVAAHPAGHPSSPDMTSDRDLLAAKLALADFAITQFFFEVDEYLTLVEDLAARGVTKPVLPGIMPVTSLRSVPRMAQMGAAVPAWAVARLEEASVLGGDEAVRRAGIELATDLCAALLSAGAPGLHFYTLNRSSATRDIYASFGLGETTDTADTAR